MTNLHLRLAALFSATALLILVPASASAAEATAFEREASDLSAALDAYRSTDGAPRELAPSARSMRFAPGIGASAYADAIGDTPLAPDIGAISVSNDDAGNLAIDAAMWPYQFLTSYDGIVLFIDADANPATGTSTGAEYGLVVDGWDDSFVLGRWTGAAWDFGTPQATLSVAYNYGLILRMNRSDIGTPTSFGMTFVTSYQGTYNTYYDVAPETGSFLYTVNITPPPAPAPAPVTPAPAAQAPATTAPAASATGAPGVAAAAVREPDLTLSIPTARTAAKTLVRAKLFSMPRYTKQACSKAGKAMATCKLVFHTTKETFTGTATVENYLDVDGSRHQFVDAVGKRTNNQCVARLRKAGKSTKPCTKSFSW